VSRDGSGRRTATGQIQTYEVYKDDHRKEERTRMQPSRRPTGQITLRQRVPRIATMVERNWNPTYSYYAFSPSQLGAGWLSTIDGPVDEVEHNHYTYDEPGPRCQSRHQRDAQS